MSRGGELHRQRLDTGACDVGEPSGTDYAALTTHRQRLTPEPATSSDSVDEQHLRSSLAVWLVRVRDGADPDPVAATRFADVSADHPHAAFIERFAQLEVTEGCRDGTRYCPDDTVTRAQMASFLHRARTLKLLELDDAPALEVLRADPHLVGTYPPPVVIMAAPPRGVRRRETGRGRRPLPGAVPHHRLNLAQAASDHHSSRLSRCTASATTSSMVVPRC